MDEYLFITLARLKADRLKLAREKRGVQTDSEQLPLELDEPVETRRPAAAQPVRNSLFARWFSQQPLWREQS